MKTQTTTERALTFLIEHFYGIGEEHDDFKEGMKSVNYLEKVINPKTHSLKTGGRN